VLNGEGGDLCMIFRYGVLLSKWCMRGMAIGQLTVSANKQYLWQLW